MGYSVKELFLCHLASLAPALAMECTGFFMEQTLFDKYGGVPVVTRIVRDFYKRVMRRPNLRRYFESVSVDHLIQHQIRFVSMAMGKAPENYASFNLKASHETHGVTGASFDLMLDLFTDALRAEEVSDEDVDLIVAVLRSKRSLIVSK